MTRRLVADRYRLGDRIGSGGMGRVWLAHDELLHRDVAVKEVLLPEGLAEDELDELHLRTLREARTAARLTHPNVVRVYDVVFTAGRPWIIMEYVQSRSLAQVVNEDGPFSPQETAQIGLALLDALGAAHMVGVLHRDIKPGNVLLAHDGRVMLTDFGLATFDEVGAALTQSGIVHGSPQFISPERALDGTSSPASDMWSLGATLYAAVEGKSPYSRPSSYETIAALTTVAPDPAVHAAELSPVLLGLLARHPADRMRAAVVRARLRLIVAADSDLDPEAPHRLSREKEQLSRQSEPEPVEEAPAPENSGEVSGGSETSGAHRRPSRRQHQVRRGANQRQRTTPTWLIIASVIAVLLVCAGLILWQMDSHQGDRANAASAGKSGHHVAASPSGFMFPSGAPGAPDGLGGPGPRAFLPPPDGLAWLCRPTPPQPTSLVPADTPPPEAQPLPNGWQWYADPNGAIFAMPSGLQMGTNDSGTTCFYDGSRQARVIGISRWKGSSKDPVSALRARLKELEAVGGLPRYKAIHAIKSVACMSLCGQWTYAYDTPVGRLDVMTRDFVQADGTAYALTWETTDSAWNGDQASIEQMMGSFRPHP